MKNHIKNKSQFKIKRVAGLFDLSLIIFGLSTKIARSRFALFTFCILLTGNIFAQEESTLAASKSSLSGIKVKNAINMCPGGIAFGIFSFNYEHLFDQSHGLVARFDYESVSETFSRDEVKANGYGFILNYRYHISGALESLFFGSYVRYKVYEGTGKTNLNRFDFTMPEMTLGLNVGKRWVWNSGFNMTIAFGYGIANSTKETTPDNASFKKTLNKFEDKYDFMGPFLGEFSLGYAF